MMQKIKSTIKTSLISTWISILAISMIPPPWAYSLTANDTKLRIKISEVVYEYTVITLNESELILEYSVGTIQNSIGKISFN